MTSIPVFEDKLPEEDAKIEESEDEKSVADEDTSSVDEDESVVDDEIEDMFEIEDPVEEEQPARVVEKVMSDADMLGLGDDSDMSDDDYDDYEKFGSTIKQDVIANHYPELVQHNYEEIKKLLDITRDDTGVIRDTFHRTIPIITRYERARVLGERTKQLDGGAHPMIAIEPNIIDSYTIAVKEYEQKKIPFIIKRPLPSGACEYWRLRDLEYI